MIAAETKNFNIIKSLREKKKIKNAFFFLVEDILGMKSKHFN